MRIASLDSMCTKELSVVATFRVISRSALAYEYINEVTDMGRARLPSVLWVSRDKFPIPGT